MAGTKALRGALRSFLGTCISRYSEFDGYWLFGFLVPELTRIEMDLLVPTPYSSPHLERARALACTKFRDQVAKAGVDLQMVRRAQLSLSRGEHVIATEVNGLPSAAWDVTVSIVVETCNGRRYEAKEQVLVARHNPAVEMGGVH